MWYTAVSMEEKKKLPARIWPVIRSYFLAARVYPWLFSFVFAGGLIIELSGIFSPLFIRQFIDTLASGDPSSQLAVTLFGILGGFALLSLVGWVGRRIQMISVMSLEAKVMADLSNTGFNYLLGHSHEFFQNNFAGSLTRKVNRYARAFEQVLDSITFQFFSTFVFATGVIVVLFQKNTILGAVLLAWTLFFVWIQVVMAQWRQPLRIARSEEDSKVTGVLSDAVSNQYTISLFASASHERSLFGGAIERWRLATMKSWNADLWIFAIQGLFAIAIEVGLLAGAVILWQKSLVTVGDFVLIQVYILGLIDRIWGIGNSMRKLYDAFADAYEMIVILEKPHDILDVPAATTLAVTKGGITFKNVGFNFNGTRAILADFNLEITKGQKVALVGTSGAGKSTITKLLLRFYELTSGHIEIDGQDIAKVTQESLRAEVAFVPQESVLFHRSLLDNIRYGRQDATDEEVIEAAKKAHCHEFIDALPEKYETHVGERGVKLSGGERQRVAIARAILKDAPILVLDEATSSLDSESEALIQDALRVLMEGKTVIVIAHRLSTIMKMDRIWVIENGKMIEEGSHTALLKKKNGLYHKLWKYQAGGFIE